MKENKLKRYLLVKKFHALKLQIFKLLGPKNEKDKLLNFLAIFLNIPLYS